MKNVRKISNLVAEELQEVLDAQGVSVDEGVFEERVSSIVGMLTSALNEGIKESNDPDDKDDDKDDDIDDDDDLNEELEVSEIFMATSDFKLGSVEVKSGEYVEVDEIDADNGTVFVTVYDADGEVKSDGIDVSTTDIENLESNSKPIEFNDESGEVVEATHIKGGKKVKVSAAIEKLRAKLKTKKGDGVNKFTIKNGKIVKKSAAQIAADKKKSKTFAKAMKKFAKKRGKSLKKAAKLDDCANGGTKKKVVEGFDITSGSMTFAAEAGDIISFEDSCISIVREGATLLKGLSVAEGFMERCMFEGVVEDVVEEDGETIVDAETVSESASLLSFQSGKGYVYVKEGSEIPLGNRIRARAFLTNEGIAVTAEMLDSAANGELVTL